MLWLISLRVRWLLASGRVDEACELIVYARRALGASALPGVRIDARSAQLVRAGLAAGRLLASAPPPAPAAPPPDNVYPIQRRVRR